MKATRGVAAVAASMACFAAAAQAHGNGDGGHGNGHGHGNAEQPALTTRGAPIITVDGLRFRDLDRDGKLTSYEDWRRTPQQRAADLAALAATGSAAAT